MQLLAQAEKPFLFGGKRQEVAATPFGGCSALGINARACPEPILEPQGRWALGPSERVAVPVAGGEMAWGKFTDLGKFTGPD